jgi:hypothetical protein
VGSAADPAALGGGMAEVRAAGSALVRAVLMAEVTLADWAADQEEATTHAIAAAMAAATEADLMAEASAEGSVVASDEAKATNGEETAARVVDSAALPWRSGVNGRLRPATPASEKSETRS